MIFNWLHHNTKARKLIVFFNGWGVDQRVVEHLRVESDTNVLIASDYSNLDAELPHDLSAYEHRSLIAWSFGVANYAVWQQSRPDLFNTRVAVNGTPQGVDRHSGISEKVVQHTIDNLCSDSYLEFLNRCFGSLDHTQSPVVNNMLLKEKQELQCIKDRKYASNDLKWDAAWVSEQDQIFPSKNQLRAWQDDTYLLIDAPHAPFSLWTDWQELLPNQ